MSVRIEELILSQLVQNNSFCHKAHPFLKSEYFHDKTDQTVFKLIHNHISTYNALPSQEAMIIAVSNENTAKDKECLDLLSKIYSIDETQDDKWVIEETEKFCKDKAIFNSIRESISIIDNPKKDNHTIQELLKDALSVSFDRYIGHDYVSSAEERWNFYHEKRRKVPTDLTMLNTITNGGFSEKTFNLFIAGVNVGKTMLMCHLAASQLIQNKNVLYITLEMAETEIAKRIDANLLDVDMNDLLDIPQDMYENLITKKVLEKTKSKLIIKEYPTGCGHAGHFRSLLDELRLKLDFEPDIVYIDYVNICASSRFSGSNSHQMYTYIKSVAEELRGLAVEYSVPVVTATQFNRGGFTNSDPGMEDTAESFGLPATADLQIALVTSDELEKQNKIMAKQIKSRYNDLSKNKRFLLGVDRAHQRFFDVAENKSQDFYDATPTEQTTQKEYGNVKGFSENDFSSWKIE